MKTAKGRHARAQRGSVLLLAIILVVVLGLLASAAISFSRSELGAARTLRTGDELAACADVGRQYLLSKFRLFNMAPQSMSVTTPSNTASTASAGSPCTPGSLAAGQRCVMSGHIGDNNTVVQAVRATATGDRSSKNARDLTNSGAGAGSLGGSDYQVVVHCIDTDTKRETEVEFVVRFGL